MKIRLFLFSLLLIGCKQGHTISEKPVAKNSVETKIVVENKRFFVGDVNNDKMSDTAFIRLKRNTETDEIECGRKHCGVNITFHNGIPAIRLEQSLGVFVAKAADVNNDHANEILVFSRTNEGWWNVISVWSLKNNTWNVLGETKAFISRDQDFENRIVNENGHYYLIGQNQWEEDENGDFKEVKIKL